MRFNKTVIATLAAGALLAILSGCQKPEGPAEHAGKMVDQAAENVGQQIEKTGADIQNAAKDGKK